jgi:uncharacterized protein
MRFEWNGEKARLNQRKHGVGFEEAMHVFEDPFALFEPDRVDDSGELRWQAVGLVGGIVVLAVAHTIRTGGEDEVIRLISARRSTRKERNRYEQTRTQNAR